MILNHIYIRNMHIQGVCLFVAKKHVMLIGSVYVYTRHLVSDTLS